MTDKLAGVHPTLIVAVTKILNAMAALGYPMRVTDGMRTQAEQAALYAKGRTAPGAVVTNADGLLKKSNHQTHADGWGHAVDCCFLVDGKPSWASDLPWELYGHLAKFLGLEWGGDFHSITDRPHIELPNGH